MSDVPRRIPNASCPDDQDPNALPIVSAKDASGNRATQLTAVVIDGEQAVVDAAALHGRTPLEQKVRWVNSRDQVPAGRPVYVVWLYIKPAGRAGGFVYHGVVAAEMWIDEAAGVGYKNLADHTNRLGRAMRGQVDLSLLDARARAALLQVLNQYPEVLQNSSPELKSQLGLAVAP